MVLYNQEILDLLLVVTMAIMASKDFVKDKIIINIETIRTTHKIMYNSIIWIKAYYGILISVKDIQIYHLESNILQRITLVIFSIMRVIIKIIILHPH